MKEMKVFSILLALSVTVFAKRDLRESELRVAHGHRAGVEVVNGREVQVIGEEVTEEETGSQELQLVVKRQKGNFGLDPPALPDAWKGRFALEEVVGKERFGEVWKMKVICDGKNSSFVSAMFWRRSETDNVDDFAKKMEMQHKGLQRMQAHWSEYVVTTVGSPDAVESNSPMFPGNSVVGDEMDGQWVSMPLYNGGSFKELLEICSNTERCKERKQVLHLPGETAERIETTWEGVAKFHNSDRLTVLALFDNALAGLEAIHKQGLIHMDLKPENIMLHCKEGQNLSIHECFGVIIGLGTNCNKTICPTQTIYGTRGYYSPEVLSFEPEKMFIPSNDVWSMGVVLFQLLYLDTPSYLNPYTKEKLFNYKFRSDPKAPYVLGEIDKLVADMLETDYQKRVTLPKVRERLRNYLRRQSIWSGFSSGTDGLSKMLDKSPSERGLAEDLPSCINGA